MTSRIIVDKIRNSAASSDGITLASDGSITIPGNVTTSGTANIDLYHGSNKKLETQTSGIKTTGYNLQSAIPSFKAYGPNQFTEFATADTTYHPFVLVNTAYNTGNHYSTTTGKFTAPVAGLYFFHFRLYCQALSETHDSNQWFSIELKKNGTTTWGSGGEYFDQAGAGNNGDNAQTLQLTAVEPLAANDEVTLSCFNYFTTRWKWHGRYTTFHGYLIG